MKKRITTAAVAASMLGGVAIGSIAMPPMAALAADNSTTATADATARTPGQWITDSLRGLVDKGTITQAQSDEIATALKAAEPRGGHGGRGGPGMNLTEAAKVLNMSESDLRTATATKSLADIAREKNVDVQKVIDALVAAENSRIDADATSGRLTQAEADARKANTVQRVTDKVNSVRPARPDKGFNGTPPAPPTTAS